MLLVFCLKTVTVLNEQWKLALSFVAVTVMLSPSFVSSITILHRHLEDAMVICAHAHHIHGPMPPTQANPL